MTIVFDAASTDTCGFNAGRTIAHTIGAGTGRVLVAMGAMNASGVSAGKVTSVTFNGTAMTLARFDSYAISANFVYIYPIPDALAAGTYNVVWTFNSADVAMEFRQASFSGCDLTTPFDSNSGASNGTQASPQSVTLTPSAGGVLVGIIGGTNNADPYVLGTSQVEIGAQTTLIGIRASGSYKASGTDLSYTWAAGQRQSTLTAISLKAAAVAAATINLAAANLSTQATLSTGVVTVTPPVAGVVNLVAANLASNATLATAAVTVVPVTGTLTSDIFKAWGSPAALVGLTVPHVTATRMTDRVQVLSLAGQVTNGAGRIVLVSASLVAGVWYMLGTWNADGSARGFKAYQAT